MEPGQTWANNHASRGAAVFGVTIGTCWSPNRIGGSDISSAAKYSEARKHKGAVAVDRLLAHERLQDFCYRIRWFALPT